MASPKTKRPVILPRRIPGAYTKATKRHSAIVGRIIWHWNRLHVIFAEAFTKVTTPDDRGLGLAVWHAIVADSGQRDMLRAVLEYKSMELSPRTSEALEWLVAVAEKLAQHRNDVAHTPMSQALDFEDHELIVLPVPFFSKPQSAERLTKPQLKRFHALLIGDLTQLYFYGAEALSQMDRPRREAWPQRPFVRSLPPGEVPKTRSQKSRQQKQQQRLAQRKASRAKRPKQSKAQRRAAAGWESP